MPPPAPSTATFFACTTGMQRARRAAGRRAAAGGASRPPARREAPRDAAGSAGGRGRGRSGRWARGRRVRCPGAPRGRRKPWARRGPREAARCARAPARPLTALLLGLHGGGRGALARSRRRFGGVSRVCGPARGLEWRARRSGREGGRVGTAARPPLGAGRRRARPRPDKQDFLAATNPLLIAPHHTTQIAASRARTASPPRPGSARAAGRTPASRRPRPAGNGAAAAPAGAGGAAQRRARRAATRRASEGRSASSPGACPCAGGGGSGGGGRRASSRPRGPGRRPAAGAVA
jgi:hypothetical protein